MHLFYARILLTIVQGLCEVLAPCQKAIGKFVMQGNVFSCNDHLLRVSFLLRSFMVDFGPVIQAMSQLD